MKWSPVSIASPGGSTSELSEQISRILNDFVAEQRAQFASLGSDVAALFDSAAQAVTGGKRLRPHFVYWGWRAAGGASEATDILRAGAAIELVHACALVHDDVIDASATRRGRRSAASELAVMLGDGRHGASAAILLGDLLLSWSDELLAASGFDPVVLAESRRYFDVLRSEVAVGQYLDVVAQASGRSSATHALRVVRYKSAKYTVERPLQFGAALARAEPTLLHALSRYGVPLGEAFQLRDDVLGVFGKPEVTGKSAGDDIREGKQTLLLACAYERADSAQLAVLRDHVADAAVSSEGIAAVRAVLEETGARAEVESMIRDLKQSALQALDDAVIADDETAGALRSLAVRATERAG